MRNAERLLGDMKYKISSPFGYRIHPITKQAQGHNGVDYATYGKKVPCYASADGIVCKTGEDRYGALFVYIRFQDLKRVGLYYHLDRIDVWAGQKVVEGDQIGIVGTTGRSTGIHLHFSWIFDNANALKYYDADYEDFEKYVFPQEDEMITKAVMLINGKKKEVNRILKGNENYVRLRDLEEVLKVDYDSQKKMPMISINK